DTHLGVRPDLRDRRVPLRALDQGGAPFPMEFLEAFNAPEAQTAVVPGAGAYSTVFDLARFYQMWLGRGELGGRRLLSPAMVELATTVHTGDMPDRFFDLIYVPEGWPRTAANRGLGFWVRGHGIFAPSVFGSLASARTFGHPGASSILAWADPARDLVFVGLAAGLIHEARNILRFHLFSDLVQSCVID
ncbi:MAG: serine hydrolase, partial [Candidatus Binatia bacterium]